LLLNTNPPLFPSNSMIWFFRFYFCNQNTFCIKNTSFFARFIIDKFIKLIIVSYLLPHINGWWFTIAIHWWYLLGTFCELDKFVPFMFILKHMLNKSTLNTICWTILHKNNYMLIFSFKGFCSTFFLVWKLAQMLKIKIKGISFSIFPMYKGKFVKKMKIWIYFSKTLII